MIVEALRGGLVETRHRVHGAVVDVTGALVARSGDPGLVTFWRSGAKPIQAVPLVEDGVIERFGITSSELALCCASHSSEPVQLQHVRELLAKIGCGERDLACGPHPPLSERVARDYAARGVPLTPIFSNCSGNHAGMLALARHHGWPVESYARLDHPVQQRCLAAVSHWTGVAVAAVGTGVDGCGVVCFALPLRSMALAYARLGNAEFGMRNSESTPAHLFRIPQSEFPIVSAMLAHPELVAGEGRPCTLMMRAHPGRVVTKVGAGGVYCGLLTQEGWGIALKVEDGNGAAAALAMATVLAELGLEPQPEAVTEQQILNTRGVVVGELRAKGGWERGNDTAAAAGAS